MNLTPGTWRYDLYWGWRRWSWRARHPIETYRGWQYFRRLDSYYEEKRREQHR